MGLQLSDDMTIVRDLDPVWLCSVVYCHRIDEEGDRGKLGRDRVLGYGDMES